MESERVRGLEGREGAFLQTDGGSDAVSDDCAPETGAIALLPAGSYSGLLFSVIC